MCWWNSVVLNTKRFNSVLFLRRLKALYSIHPYQHLSWSLFCAWYRIWRKKVIYVCCNFLVIVFQNYFNFRVIIWSWQHLRVHTSLCLCEIIEDWTPCGLSLLLTVAFRLNIRVKVTSTMLENIRRSSWTIHRASSKRTTDCMPLLNRNQRNVHLQFVFIGTWHSTW